MVGKEEMLSLVEGSRETAKRLRLPHIAHAQALMRFPMMPCLAPHAAKDGVEKEQTLLQGYPRWPEPIRNRNKAWIDDPELRWA